jgi:hypothetical protein
MTRPFIHSTCSGKFSNEARWVEGYCLDGSATSRTVRNNLADNFFHSNVGEFDDPQWRQSDPIADRNHVWGGEKHIKEIHW